MDNNPRWAKFVSKIENNPRRKLISTIKYNNDNTDINSNSSFRPISPLSSNSNDSSDNRYKSRLSPNTFTFDYLTKLDREQNQIKLNTKNAAETIQKIVRKYLEEKHKKNKEKNCTDCFVMGGKRKTRRVKKSKKSKKTKKSKKSKKSRKSRK